MPLVEKIKDDIKEAMKARDAERVSVLRLLAAAATNKEKEKRAKLAKGGEASEEKIEKLMKLTDEETLAVTASEIRKRKDAIEQFEKAGRTELAATEKKELAILQQYMPKQLDNEEIKKIVQAKIAELNAAGPRDTGKVMGAVMSELKGKADGGLVNRIVQEELK